MLKTKPQINKRNYHSSWLYHIIGIIAISALCVVGVIHNITSKNTYNESENEIAPRELLADAATISKDSVKRWNE